MIIAAVLVLLADHPDQAVQPVQGGEFGRQPGPNAIAAGITDLQPGLVAGAT